MLWHILPLSKNCSSCGLDVALSHIVLIIFQWTVQPYPEACRRDVLIVPWSLCYWCIQRRALEFWTVQPPKRDREGWGGVRGLKSVKQEIIHNSEKQSRMSLITDSATRLITDWTAPAVWSTSWKWTGPELDTQWNHLHHLTDRRAVIAAWFQLNCPKTVNIKHISNLCRCSMAPTTALKVAKSVCFHGLNILMVSSLEKFIRGFQSGLKHRLIYPTSWLYFIRLDLCKLRCSRNLWTSGKPWPCKLR